jgi:hypothetical protein
MKNKHVSLLDMIKLRDNEPPSKQYIQYLCGISEQAYRHQEILDIYSLVNATLLQEVKYEGYIYGYVVPQLNKEFDLLKITSTSCVNIELKSQAVPPAQLKRQLQQNIHYLKLLNKSVLRSYIFISSSKTVYRLNRENDLIEVPLAELSSTMVALGDAEDIDLDMIFTLKNVLVSPLNSTDRFLHEDYLLTEHQANIKKAVLEHIKTNTDGRFAGITGGPGTGKTLLIYDIARELAKTYSILMVHSGILCEGHQKLNDALTNIKIIAAKELRFREIRGVDIVIVDEAHRLYTDSYDKIVRWVKRAKTICLFSYDAGQTLSRSERMRATADSIDTLCAHNTYKLTNKIRTNKELALFITCLRDVSKYRPEYSFPNVKLLYEPDKTNAVKRAKQLSKEEYTYISYTPSLYNPNLNYQTSDYNTHNVIGQEFEGVCMILDDNWFYFGDKLMARIHPNPDYLFTQLLYQGLTRVRSKLALIICSKAVFEKVLALLKNN